MFRTLLISMFITSTALADTWTVDDDGKADFDNIQAAVDASSDGDEIVVMPGTYTSTQDGHVVNMLGKAVTLRSSDPSDPDVVAATIIDGEGARRGIACFNGETNKTVIEGITISNGYSVDFDYDGDGEIDWWEDNGGGMWNYYSSPTLTRCTFDHNASGVGAGMYNKSSNPTLVECTFDRNYADKEGGGIVNYQSDPQLESCTFVKNTANAIHGGGGMYNYLSDPLLTNCTFIDNASTGIGSYGGGGMHNFTSSPILRDCTFNSNTADFGGGIFNHDNSNPTLIGCIFTNNSAFSGGGMSNHESSPTLTDTTVCGNSPDQIYGDWTDDGGNTIADVCAIDCPDINGDGYVNVNDLLAVIDQWGLTDSPADVNFDGIVDVSDLLIVIGNWGPCE